MEKPPPSPPLTECSGKDELNQFYPTPSVTADLQRVTRVISVLPVSFTKNPRGMFRSGFFSSSESKNWEVKELYLSRTLPQTGKGGSGQFILCLVSEEPHLQC